MKSLRITTFILAVLIIPNELDGQFWEIVRGNHEVVTKERNTGSFTGIKVSSGIDVYLRQGNKESVSVEADENLHEYIITEVKNGVLHVYSDVSIRDADCKAAHVTMKEIKYLSTSSAGDITGESPIKADYLELSASSAGNIRLEVTASDIEVNISSSGDITLSGKAERLDANLSSAGDLNAFDLEVAKAEVIVSSAGDADIRVSEKLTARASSAGDINYTGNPKYVDARTSSAGNIRKR
jgi:uncharacterized protein YxeA